MLNKLVEKEMLRQQVVEARAPSLKKVDKDNLIQQTQAQGKDIKFLQLNKLKKPLSNEEKLKIELKVID